MPCESKGEARRSTQRVYVFDVDGVLVDGPFKTGIFPEVCHVLQPYVMATFGCNGEEATRRIMDTICARVRTLLCSSHPVSAYDWDTILNWVAKKFGYPDSFDIVAMVEKYCAIPGYARLRGRDVPEVLRELRSRGSRLVVLTNGFLKYQRPVLKSVGLLGMFDAIITPTEVGTVKPDPRPFRCALELAQALKTGSGISNGVVIGDSLSQDIWGANRAGLCSVWLVNSLPASWLTLDPLSRATVNGMSEFVQRHLETELLYQACGRPRVKECSPSAIVTSVRELLKLDWEKKWVH